MQAYQRELLKERFAVGAKPPVALDEPRRVRLRVVWRPIVLLNFGITAHGEDVIDVARVVFAKLDTLRPQQRKGAKLEGGCFMLAAPSYFAYDSK